MLFRDQTLAAIALGEVTLAFRRWKRPTVKAGGRVRTASGVVLIGGIAVVENSIAPRTLFRAVVETPDVGRRVFLNEADVLWGDWNHLSFFGARLLPFAFLARRRQFEDDRRVRARTSEAVQPED